MCLTSLLSHLLRSIRWLFLLRPLSSKKVALWNSFCAVIYGYAVNLAIPRGGELVRLLAITKTEKLPAAGVLSTLLIDRLLDIALLMLLLAATLTILPDSVARSMPWLLPFGVVLSLFTLSALLALPVIGPLTIRLLAWQPLKTLLPQNIERIILTFLNQFNEGTRSLTSPVTYPAITFLSFLIWFFYWLSFYLVVWAFHLGSIVSPIKSLAAFALGSVSVLVPTPGSIGSVHLMVSQSLMLIAGINKDMALSFATILHALSFVLVPCIAAIFCFVVNMAGNTKRQVNKTNPG